MYYIFGEESNSALTNRNVWINVYMRRSMHEASAFCFPSFLFRISLSEAMKRKKHFSEHKPGGLLYSPILFSTKK